MAAHRMVMNKEQETGSVHLLMAALKEREFKGLPIEILLLHSSAQQPQQTGVFTALAIAAC